MNLKRTCSISVAFLVLSCVSAFAWPACSGNWIQVPTGTKGTASSGVGSVVTENGQTYQCQNPSPTPSTGSTATASSTAAATSSSAANATGGDAKATATGGTVKDSGNSSVKNTLSNTLKDSGNSTIKDSGNSTIKDSGNSSNVNKNTANGGAGGDASQQQQQSNSSTNNNASSASNNGNNSNNTTINQAKIPVNTAYAPTAIPTMGCFKGFGAGIQTGQVGASFGGGKVDENCERLEVARSYGIAGSWDAYCMVMVTNKYSKEAGVTFEQCMKRVTEAPAPAPVPVAEQPKPQIIVVPVTVQTPAPVAAPVVTQTPATPDAPPAFRVTPSSALTTEKKPIGQ